MAEPNPSHQSRIFFEEVSGNAGDFLHELSDPNLLRNREIPVSAKTELRRHQVARLQATISVLSEKRREFNRRMDEYVQNLEKLVENLESELPIEPEAEDATDSSGCTRVCCLHCETERCFEELNVVFARESEESLEQPTELYVLEKGSLKKGHFRCVVCGTESLVIKAAT